VSYNPARKVLYRFNKPSDLERWRVVSDKEISGKSNATLELSADRTGAVFSGDLSLETSREGARAGYVAIISEVLLFSVPFPALCGPTARV
jgi:hypothetical protein